MKGKPRHAAGYTPESVQRVRRTLLLVASKLGDLMDDIVVVGGLVPYLLVDQTRLPAARRHVGTMDLDLGLSLAILNKEKYREISSRLRSEGFQPDSKSDGGIRRQTWVHGEGADRVTIDFLIQLNDQSAVSGKLTQIESDFAAITVEGLELAFIAKRRIALSGALPNGATLSRPVWVCGPAAFVTLKANAYRIRGENKDAYDLFYLLREVGVSDALADFQCFDREHPTIQRALRILQEDFLNDTAGRVQAAEFISGSRDDAIEGDVLAHIARLLDGLGAKS